MNSASNLGLAIKQVRESAGLTQDDLSDKAGLAYSTLAKIEQGAIKNPSIFTVFAIAEVLGVTVEQLMEIPVVDRTTPKTGRSNIKFVYCDMNGVIVRFYYRAFVTLSEETGQPLDKVESTCWHFNDVANRGDISLEEFNKEVALSLGVKSIDWQRHYMAAIQPITEMHECLKTLQKHYRLGLLTNTMPGFIDVMKANKQLPDIKFDAVVDSSVVGAVKPDDKVYKLAEKAAGVTGNDIFFIDDSRANLTAAEKFGWRVFWFDDYDPEESIRRIKETLAV